MTDSEKILKFIIYTLIIGAFISCLFIFRTWIFPYITSKAIPFRIIVELMSLSYLILTLFKNILTNKFNFSIINLWSINP